jgi:hypothetical protein
MKPRQGRQIGKMSLLLAAPKWNEGGTELEILGAGFLQRWRAYGASDTMDEGGGHDYFFQLVQKFRAEIQLKLCLLVKEAFVGV